MTVVTSKVKCLVWDLDETLWRGTLAEGDDLVVIAGVREVIAALDGRGILHSVASRNDHDLAWARLVEFGLADYFVLPRIGWGAKSESVRAIAAGLDFAESAMAFVDDQPTERAEVAFHLPAVRCYPAEQVTRLPDLAEFTPTAITADSARRRLRYQDGLRREAARAAHTGPDADFLRTLDLRLSVTRATEDDLDRVAELTVRTTQMNATGVPYDHGELRELTREPDHEVLVVGLTDRFGSHGAVGIMLLRIHPAVWHLKLLATSCRVVSFGTGAALLTWLGDAAARAGAHLAADFRPTERNRMMEIAYRFAGFGEDTCDCLPTAGVAGVTRLHLVPDRREVPAYFTVDAVDLAGVRHG